MFSTGILLTMLTGILIIIGWLAGGVWGVSMAFIVAAIIIITSYSYYEKFLLKMYKARPTKNVLLENIVKELARDASLPTPKIYMIETDEPVPNSFSTGKGPKRSSIVVTSGLLSLERHEIEAVIAHELGHVKKKDGVSSGMAAIIGGAIAYPANYAYWKMKYGEVKSGSIMLTILMYIFGPIAAFFIRSSIPDRMEYKADYASAVVTKRPKSLVSALNKMSAVFEERTIRGSIATSHLWVVNPFKGHWLINLFSTNPSIYKRIERLRHMHGEG